MEIYAEFIKPLSVMILLVGMVAGICFICYRSLKGKGLWFKYKIFRKKYDEEQVGKCIELIEGEKDFMDFKKKELVKGKVLKDLNEMEYIYVQVCKELKGGIKK